MSVRKYSLLPLNVIVAMSGAAPSQSKRFVREILARITLASKQDPEALPFMYEALGKVVSGYWESLDVKDRIRFNIHAMTSEERKSFLNALLEPIGDAENGEEVPE